MATRENQGLQIALIIFVMLTIVLIVTTYLFFRSYSDERDKGKNLAEQKASADQATQKAIVDADDMKNLIGAAQTETVEVAKEASKKEMQTFGEGLVESKQNYRGLVEHLVAKLRKFETANTDLEAKVTELNAKLKTNDDAANAEVAKLSEQLDSTAADLKKERQTFLEKRSEIDGEKDLLAAGFETTRKEHEKLVQKSSEQISTLSTRLGRADQLLDAMRSKGQVDEKANEVADGKITRVSQRSRLVWLNVGPADGLRRQTSFAVVAPEDGNPIKSKPKGTIEVIRFTDAHHAEARIVEDDLSNPIMVGDHIFSVVWDAGRPEHFALAGKIDADGDGESDHAKLRDLVALNGGIIDAEVGDDGTRSGQMSINTKYLVLGDRPDDTSKDRESYGAILGEAQTLGVKTINVAEFLDYMGYQDDHRTVGLGSSAKASDFRPRLPGDVQRIVPGSTLPRDPRKTRGSADKSAN
ncbi:MAG: hypothetical protein WDZ48_10115 [Pirellulales bacterium]